jgi:hypothetical protein
MVRDRIRQLAAVEVTRSKTMAVLRQRALKVRYVDDVFFVKVCAQTQRGITQKNICFPAQNVLKARWN